MDISPKETTQLTKNYRNYPTWLATGDGNPNQHHKDLPLHKHWGDHNCTIRGGFLIKIQGHWGHC